MSKRYLVKFSVSSDGKVSVLGLVKPDANGNARFDIYQVADEEWVRKNFDKDICLKDMELNDNWITQLVGGKE